MKKLQSRPQMYDILAYLQRKSVVVDYNLFISFETERRHFVPLTIVIYWLRYRDAVRGVRWITGLSCPTNQNVQKSTQSENKYKMLPDRIYFKKKTCLRI